MPQNSSKTGQKITNLAVLGLSLLAAFALGEVAFRYFIGAGLSEMPFWYELNSGNFRDYEHPEKAAENQRRVMILGDSYAFGLGVKNSQVLARQLEARAREFNPKPVEAINLAKMGWNTCEEAACFEREGVKYDFDDLVLAYTFNDIELEPAIVNQRTYSLLTDLTSLHALVYRLYMLKSDSFSKAGSYSLELVNQYRDKSSPEWQRMTSCIKRLNEYCKARGKRFVVLYFELFCNDPVSLRYVAWKELGEFLKSEGIAFAYVEPRPDCDLRKYQIHQLDTHPNALGHKLATDALIRELSKP